MKKYSIGLLLVSSLLNFGCNSVPFIDSMQPEATAQAVRRAKFELNCPAATAQIISRETIEPVSFRFGVERAEYTVGVAGCGQRATYIVICPDNGSGCFTGGGRTEIQR